MKIKYNFDSIYAAQCNNQLIAYYDMENNPT